MNPHYHPYSELSSPHPPSPDNNNYPPLAGGHHHNGHGPFMSMEGQQGFHQINNNIGPMKQCGGCGGKIVERYYLHALDKYWHNSCLKCSCCGTMLADIGSSCYTKAGMILCKADYSRMFGMSGPCSACGQTIQANELVMRTTPQLSNNQAVGNPNQNLQSQVQHQVFHPKCFACSKCAVQLMPGDRYYMLAGSLVCEQDWQKLIKNTGTAAGTPPIRKGKVGRPRRSRD
ncbi:LIM domain transcription factor LMO4 [Sergentomyia squamirostris]